MFDGQKTKLPDLGEIVTETKKKVAEYKSDDVILSNKFKKAFSDSIAASGNSIEYKASTAIISNSAGQKINAPNQWFVLAKFAMPLAKQVINYRSYTEKYIDANIDAIKSCDSSKIKEKKDIYQILRAGDEMEPLKSQLVDLIQHVFTASFISDGFEEDIANENASLLIKFMTDSKWWLGGKGIERTNDYYVSPILGVLNLVNASQGYVATITYMYINDESLTNALESMEENIDNDSVSDEDNEELDEYQRAALIIKKYGEEHDLMNAVSDDSIQAAIDDFNSRFTPEKLNALSDDEILSHMFITVNDNSNALCYWLENKDISKDIFGKIGVGSSLHYGLYQDHASGKWTTKADKGDKETKKELTDAEAIEKAKEIRDKLVSGASLIEQSKLESLEDYEALYVELKKILGDDFINMQWVHKYFAVLFPDKFSSYHSPDWQRHVLFSLGIVPGDNIYVRSGQISMVQNHINLIYKKFATICYAKYGRPKTFLRIGTTGTRNFMGEWKKENVVGIGWSDTGSLDDYAVKGKVDKDKLYTAMTPYYKNDATNHTKKTNEMITFYEADSDCIFVPADGEKIYALVDNVSDYVFDKNQEFAHLRKGNWIMCFPSEGIKLPSPKDALQTSCKAFKKDENLFYLYQAYYNDNDEVEDEPLIEEIEELKNCLDIERSERTTKLHPLNFIIYGAPGTGKTYSTAEYALAIANNCTRSKIKEDYANNRKGLMKAYNDLIKEGQVVFTTFHQSYGYEEFIQGLRPDTKSDKMAFKTVDGVFKRIADIALNDKENRNFIIIIDEINRANISKVFGELITLIEDDKRWGEVNETCATLQSGDVFAVPNNLYILGTMNSADKSISLIDAALRRRFSFVEQKPEADLVSNTTLKGVLERLNLYLAGELKSSDLLIGHSYFINKEVTDLPSIMNGSIIPLLYEYFYDNKKSVKKALDEALKGVDNISIVDDPIGRLYVE